MHDSNKALLWTSENHRPGRTGGRTKVGHEPVLYMTGDVRGGNRRNSMEKSEKSCQ